MITFPGSQIISIATICTTIDREIFAHKNFRLLNFRIVLFSSLREVRKCRTFILFNVKNFAFIIFVVIGYRQKFINGENFPDLRYTPCYDDV